MSDTEFRQHGVCAQTDPEAFYPADGQSATGAVRVCQACPVRAECLEYALRHDERFGVWGGMTEQQRRRLRRHRGLPSRAARDRADKQATARRMFAAGRSKSEIGRLLGLSGTTLNSYLATQPAGFREESTQNAP